MPAAIAKKLEKIERNFLWMENSENKEGACGELGQCVKTEKTWWFRHHQALGMEEVVRPAFKMGSDGSSVGRASGVV